MLKGCAFEGCVAWEARMMAYEMSSLPNCWSRDTLPVGHFLIKKQTVCACDPCYDACVVNIGTRDKELMNSLPLQWCSGLSSSFHDGNGCVVWEYLGVPLWFERLGNISPLSNDASMLSKVYLAWSLRNSLVYILGGSFTRGVHLLLSWCMESDGCLAMNQIWQTDGVKLILYF
jgi:hypothetical protein